jgi:SWIM/SEC-C metal-binding protein
VHDLYYKGRIHTRKNHITTGFKNERNAKLGTEKNPLTLVVNSETRKIEIEAIVAEKEFYAEINVNTSADEDITELDAVLNTPITTTFEKTPNRNDPCSCSSGKKYKKCCG